MIDLGNTPKNMSIQDAADRAVKTLAAIYEEWGNVGGLTFQFNGEVVTVWRAYSANTVVHHYRQAVEKREMVSR